MDKQKTHTRMVVEEVGAENNASVNTEPLEQVKEKVEELQDITENIEESVDKSAEVQEDLAKVVNEVVPEPVEVSPQKPSEQMSDNLQSSPEIRSGGPNPLVIIVPGIFLLGALLGGIMFYQRQISGTQSPTPTPAALYQATSAPSASASPSAAINLTKYPINVLNGSGTAGQAGVVKDLLTTAGFTVSGTGNADTYDFTKSVIKAKADVPSAFLSQLSTALSKNYVLDINQSLATSSADEVEVIVGSTKAQ